MQVRFPQSCVESNALSDVPGRIRSTARFFAPVYSPLCELIRVQRVRTPFILPQAEPVQLLYKYSCPPGTRRHENFVIETFGLDKLLAIVRDTPNRVTVQGLFDVSISLNSRAIWMCEGIYIRSLKLPICRFRWSRRSSRPSEGVAARASAIA